MQDPLDFKGHNTVCSRACIHSNHKNGFRWFTKTTIISKNDWRQWHKTKVENNGSKPPLVSWVKVLLFPSDSFKTQCWIKWCVSVSWIETDGCICGRVVKVINAHALEKRHKFPCQLMVISELKLINARRSTVIDRFMTDSCDPKRNADGNVLLFVQTAMYQAK